LRETLTQQTGITEGLRIGFLNDFHSKARAVLIHTWEVEEICAPSY